MYTYAGQTPDLHLAVIGSVIWLAAMGVAFGVYLPARRRGGAGSAPAFVAAMPTLEPFDRAAPAIPAPVFAPAVEDCAGEAPQPPRERPAAFSVLIVDDNAINRK